MLPVTQADSEGRQRTRMKKNVYRREILRTIIQEKKRFVSILIITVLGIVMLCSLRAACVDLRIAADNYYDEQNLYDIAVQSTLGLTDDDLEVLAALEGISAAEGGFTDTVYLTGDSHESVQIKTFVTGGMNQPYVIEGTLPQAADEIAVASNYITDSGKTIGDTVTIEEISDDEEEEEDADDESSDEEEEEEESDTGYVTTTFTITAIVTDPADINNKESSISFRDTSTTDYTFFITPGAVDSDIYTIIYLTVDGAIDLNCYTDAGYTEAVDAVIDQIEAEIKTVREEARTQEVIAEAQEEIDDAEEEMNDAFADAEEELADAEKELADARSTLADAEEEIADGWDEIEEARVEIADGWDEIEENALLLAEAQAELDDARTALAQTQADTQEQIADGWEELADARAQLEEALSTAEAQAALAKEQLGDAWPAEAFDALRSAAAAGEDTTEAAAALTSVLDSTFSSTIELLESQITSLNNMLALLESSTQTDAETKQDTDAQETASSAEAAEGSSADAGTEAAITDETTSGDTSSSDDEAQADGSSPGDADSTEATAAAAAGCTAEDLTNQLAALSEQLATLQALIESLPQLAVGLGQIDAGLAEIEIQEALLAQQEEEAAAQFTAAWAAIEENQQTIDDSLLALEEARSELADAEEVLTDSEAELLDGEAELADGQAELADGEEELADAWATYLEEKADAEQELADAKTELADLDDAVWYVQDRTALSGYSNVEGDSGAIEAIGTAFPVVFLAVAILISLTTITRMVEEERGLIGTYKALGFSDAQTRKKYLIFALTACVAGSLIGWLGGFIILPEIIFIFFRIMYTIPSYTLTFDPLYGFAGPAIFLIGIALATWLAVRSVTRQLPAGLLRPKTPASGSVILLERIRFIWKRLSFLNKVTARNLFRYKKRLCMTVLGILGCTALLVCGFAIKDSVSALMTKQYDDVYNYDLMAVATDQEELLTYMDGSDDVEDYISLRIDSVYVEADGNKETIQLYVVADEDAETLCNYITLTSIGGETVIPDNSGILVTRNAGTVLGFSAGDTVTLQDLTLTSAEVTVTALVENYLGNSIYMTQSLYEELFGDYETNGVLAHLSEDCADPITWADELSHQDGITSATAVASLREDFSSAFVLMNVVVYVIIVMATGLAFVVLFTLSTTNISERERELATIKVLGFFDHEVHLYVNKETLLLTVIGILPGLPVGALLGHAITSVLNMPSIYFAVTIQPVSYLYSAGLAIIFALIVQQITNRILNAIDPVEALKSVE